MEENLVSQKINKIKGLIGRHIKNNPEENVYLSFQEIGAEPLLSNRKGLEKILNLISKGSNGHITWEIKKIYKMVRGSARAADPNSVTPTSYLEETGVELHILNPLKLDAYFKTIINELGVDKNKEIIFIDDKKGIYKPTGETYAISRGRLEVVLYLRDKEKASLAQLKKLRGWTDQVVSQSIKNINDTFHNKIDKKDLIIHGNTSGYSLNTDVFEIRSK